MARDWGENHAVRQQLQDNQNEAQAAAAAAAVGAPEAAQGQSGADIKLCGSGNGLGEYPARRRPGLPGYTQWVRLRRAGMTDAESMVAEGEDELAAYYDWLIEAQRREDTEDRHN